MQKFYRKALLFEKILFQSLANFNVKKWKCLWSSPFNGQHQVLLLKKFAICDI